MALEDLFEGWGLAFTRDRCDDQCLADQIEPSHQFEGVRVFYCMFPTIRQSSQLPASKLSKLLRRHPQCRHQILNSRCAHTFRITAAVLRTVDTQAWMEHTIHQVVI